MHAVWLHPDPYTSVYIPSTIDQPTQHSHTCASPISSAAASSTATSSSTSSSSSSPPALSLSLEDLKTKFPRATVTTTMQCAGNRRAGLNRVKPAQGLAWDCGAIGTAVWTGVWLRDVLAEVGVDAAAAKRGGLKHVQFLPLDPPYDASIPMRQALDEDGDVLLAFEMNGEELTREHGYGHTS